MTTETTNSPATSSAAPIAGAMIVIGVDGSLSSSVALDLVAHLGFESARFTLVYTVESPLTDVSYPDEDAPSPLRDWLRESATIGRGILRNAGESIRRRDPAVEERVEYGDPAAVLLRIAQQEQADLVVVGNNRRSRLDDILLGSTARAIVRACPQHVLVARSKGAEALDPVVVFATDDSPEAKRCLDEFIRLAPKWTSRVYVLTVNEIDSGAAAMLVRGLPHFKRTAEDWIANGLREEAESQCVRLREAGFEAVPLVVEGGNAALAIADACDTVGASLIVVASSPRGFWDRWLNGSVTESLFENDSRSLLILRP
jgi:nucleotide-binding universal stress UspA family protein